MSTFLLVVIGVSLVLDDHPGRGILCILIAWTMT